MFSLKDFTDKFVGFPKESLEAFMNLATEVELKKNHIITEIGSIEKHFYVIKSGIARVFFIDENSKEYTRTIFTAGNTTGSLSSLISGTPSQLSYETLTDCIVYKFVHREFKTLTKKDKYILLMYNKILEHIFLMMESRIYELSVLNATQRYLRLKKEIPEIETLIPQYHIASYLNVSAVQLSRIRKEIYSK